VIADQTIICSGRIKTIETEEEQDSAAPERANSHLARRSSEIIIYDDLFTEVDDNFVMHDAAPDNPSKMISREPTNVEGLARYLRPTISSQIKKEIQLESISERKERNSRHQTPKHRDG